MSKAKITRLMKSNRFYAKRYPDIFTSLRLPSVVLTLAMLIGFSGILFAQNIDPQLRKLLKKSIQEMSQYSDRFDAEVWLKDMDNRLKKYVKNSRMRIEILKLVYHEANRAQLKPEWVLAVMEVESHFQQYAISVSGARGLMQIMPFWLDELKIENDNLFHLHTNIRMGCTILKYYLDMEKGNLNNALARYNGSYGKSKYPDKVFKALQAHWYDM